MHDFAPQAYRREHRRTAPPITSTAFANSYGLVGEWTASQGLALLHATIDETTAVSRLAVGDIGLAVDDPCVVPAVHGLTVWPSRPSASAVIAYPNRVGVIEPTDPLEAHRRVSVVLYPDLAGDIALPWTTSILTLMLASGAITLSAGDTMSLDGSAATIGHRTPDERKATADVACQRARLLAKHLTQIAEVTVDDVPTTGRLLVTTPAEPSAILEGMEQHGVVGGVPIGLAEYPGGIVVDCSRSHTDEALATHAGALAAALAKTRRIGG